MASSKRSRFLKINHDLYAGSHVQEYCAISSNIEQIIIMTFKCLTIAANSIGLCTVVQVY